MTLALVTGASSGIGADISRALAARGHDLVLVARDKPSLERLANSLIAEHDVHAVAVPADLTDLGDLDTVTELARRADILVNNAGACLGRSLEHTTWDHEHHMLVLNVLAPTRLTHAALPAMLERRAGRILTVSSVAALAPVWRGTTYAPSKAFALALTQSLARSHRVRRSPVALTALVLGHTVSEFHARAGIAPSPRLLTLPGPYVAEKAVSAIHRRRPPIEFTPSLRYKVISRILRHTPHLLLTLPRLTDDFTVNRPVSGRDSIP
ncbi:SDR family NAD(P)-dependent oxidoreductase [Streptomyces mirabilis]|uniref:SDR family NAD(P)-dependent oxidoreductase n=1 Tax=Streptomyces mirabilis TaxID=68239 RepID=UPI003407BE3A